MINKLHSRTSLVLFLLLLIPISIHAECTCESESENNGTNKRTQALKYKIIALASILIAGAIGVSFPFLGKIIPSLRPQNNIFFIIKAFAAGVILATGFIHVLPDAFESLTSPCLNQHPWGDFPFTGFVAMVLAIGTMMVDSLATSYYRRLHLNKGKTVDCNGDDQEKQGHVHVHTHNGIHGHAHHGSSAELEVNSGPSDLLRHQIISQVLEVGIVVHSVIIGISLGASMNPKTIKPLVAALTFHQMFEGMGLGACISEAKFKAQTIATMSIFFSLTTPLGIAIGFGISNIYDENSQTALIVEGIFNSASAGILIYMALVDLLAADFMSPRVQSNLKLQFGAYISLLIGSGCMSLLAKWA